MIVQMHQIYSTKNTVQIVLVLEMPTLRVEFNVMELTELVVASQKMKEQYLLK